MLLCFINRGTAEGLNKISMEKIDAMTLQEALQMVGKEYRFALNRQMRSLRCVVTGVDYTRGRPLFVISLNVDPNIGEFEPGETHLSRVEPKFLYRE